jgi:hypothetical protein
MQELDRNDDGGVVIPLGKRVALIVVSDASDCPAARQRSCQSARESCGKEGGNHERA